MKMFLFTFYLKLRKINCPYYNLGQLGSGEVGVEMVRALRPFPLGTTSGFTYLPGDNLPELSNSHSLLKWHVLSSWPQLSHSDLCMCICTVHITRLWYPQPLRGTELVTSHVHKSTLYVLKHNQNVSYDYYCKKGEMRIWKRKNFLIKGDFSVFLQPPCVPSY